MRLTLTVCDVCQDKDAETKRYEIKQGDRKVAVDLCAAHGQTFEAYLERTPTSTPRGAQRGAQRSSATKKTAAKKTSGGRSSRTTTLEEIEELKKQGKA